MSLLSSVTALVELVGLVVSLVRIPLYRVVSKSVSRIGKDSRQNIYIDNIYIYIPRNSLVYNDSPHPIEGSDVSGDNIGDTRNAIGSKVNSSIRRSSLFRIVSMVVSLT